MIHTNSLEKTLGELAAELDAELMRQLNELLKRNLLVIERGGTVLVQDRHSFDLKIQQRVTLKLKDQEYIEKLEAENAELKKRLQDIQGALKSF